MDKPFLLTKQYICTIIYILIRKKSLYCGKYIKTMEILLHEVRILLNSLPTKIKKSNFKPQALIRMTGIPSATFYKRMKDSSFTINEAEKLFKILDFEKDLEHSLSLGEKDIQEGRVQTIEELELKYA